MDKCLIYGCPNNLSDTTNTSVEFYQFPKHPVIAQRWLQCCSVWNQDEVDLSTAKICSMHFDNDSYTSEYKMSEFGYTRLLKYDALPTLYLPQQTIVYRMTSVDENFTNNSYEHSSVIIENSQYTVQGNDSNNTTTKYEELQAMPLQNDNYSIKIEEAPIILEEKYKAVASFKQLEEIKMKNEKIKKEVLNLEKHVNCLKKKLATKVSDYKRHDAECNKLRKTLTSLETKSLSLNEQKNLLAKVFSESQIKILSGKKKIYWSHDDMAIGYTIRHMSSKRFYMYLSKKLNIPLPGLSSIKRWQSLKKEQSIKEEKSGKDDKNEDSDELM